jgi:DNA-binding NtrC family response regulator/tetratricopeptide (TPR) repeat protein
MAEGGRDDSAARSSRGTIPPAPPLPSGSGVAPGPVIPPAPSRGRLAVAQAADVSAVPASMPPPAPPTIQSASPPLVELLETLALGRDSAVVVTASDDAMRAAATTHVSRLLRQRASAISSVLSQSQAGGQNGAEMLSPEAMVRSLAARRLDEGEIVDALAHALGVELESRRVGQVAEKLADRLRRGRVSVVLRIDEPASSVGSWVALVLRELVAALVPAEGASTVTPSLARLVLVGPPSCPTLSSLGVPTVALAPDLDPREVWSWIDAVARGAGRALSTTQTTLPQLEGALAQVSAVPALSPLSVELGPPLVHAVQTHDETSPWTWLRRATVALEKGEHDAADHAIARAEELADDPDARRDVGRRWSELLEPRAPLERLEHARRSTARALGSADAEEAVRWAKLAVRAGELAQVSDGEAALLLESQGRALVAKGDVVMARAVLARARERAVAGNVGPQALGSIAVETAEAAYLAGDLASSESEARRAIASIGANEDVRLRGRNVLGKILLAKGHWELADAHFASDATEAARLGDRRAELRALLNRAIALLSAERLDEAEGLFEVVLEGGRALAEPRAQALALENLAVIASLRRDYGMALERFRAAINGLKRMGQAAMLAGAAHNLGYLYLRLGDVTQAASMVRYAATLFRRGLAAPVVAEGDDLRARIAARMGRSEEALAAISHAREILRSAGHPTRVADCDRLEARLALDDGDVRGARLALDRARGVDDSPRSKAEHALLEAEWIRANGGEGPQILVAAREALALCRASTDEDVIVEAHLLIAEVARVASDRELLQRHIEAAAGVRDAMMGSIPESYHPLFLARPDMVRLAKLERFVESEPILPLPPAAMSDSAGARISRSIATPTEPRRMVGSDPSIRALVSAVRRVAASDTHVLIHGESGTGKELVAEALHFASDRAQGPMVKVNCAALVETLLLSELFGHEKGAFTGAVARRRGRFELADGGTLFLDEIGDISPRTQVALLRVLQEKTFERVGGTTPIRVDTRIVCATHRDLGNMVTRGEFREDLFYRLRGVQLEVPPLRARLADLGELCIHVLKRIAAEHNQPVRGVSPDAIQLLSAHKWPGNIRELENVLRAVALLADGPEITAHDLLEHVDVLRTVEPLAPPSLRGAIGPTSVSGPVSEEIEGDEEGGALPSAEASATAVAYGQIRGGAVSLFEMKRMIERDCIARALSETRGNITRAAALLGMKRPRLSQLVKHYGLSSLFTEGS